MDNCDTGALILAAGVSERMKRLKAFLPFDERLSFVEKIINTYVEWGCCEITLVMNPEAAGQLKTLEHIPGFVKVVINDRLEYERFYSAKLGLRKMKKSYWCFLQNVDNPFLTKEILDQLHKEKQSDVYVSPVFDGKGGHPVLLGRKIIDHISQYPANDANLKEVLQQLKCRKVFVNDERVLININSMEQYEAMFNIELH